MFALFTMVGIGQACQPIISFNHGAGNTERVREALFLGLRYAFGSGIVYLLIILLGGAHQLASYYIVGKPALIELTATSLILYFLTPPLMGLNIVVANLFQATANPMQATIISVSRGFIFVVLGMIILPLLFPENGIWGSVVFAELITAAVSLAFLALFLRRQKEHYIDAVV